MGSLFQEIIRLIIAAYVITLVIVFSTIAAVSVAAVTAINLLVINVMMGYQVSIGVCALASLGAHIFAVAFYCFLEWIDFK